MRHGIVLPQSTPIISAGNIALGVNSTVFPAVRRPAGEDFGLGGANVLQGHVFACGCGQGSGCSVSGVENSKGVTRFCAPFFFSLGVWVRVSAIFTL